MTGSSPWSPRKVLANDEDIQFDNRPRRQPHGAPNRPRHHESQRAGAWPGRLFRIKKQKIAKRLPGQTLIQRIPGTPHLAWMANRSARVSFPCL